MSKTAVSISKQDIDQAFRIISNDGKKITNDDIAEFKTVLSNSLSVKSNHQIWDSPNREEFTREGLISLLIRKGKLNVEMEYFNVLEEKQPFFTRDFLKLFCESVDGYVHKNDVRDLIKQFDLDLDGQIGKSDFEKI